MKATDRKTHWEKQYSDKSPIDVSWFQEDPALSLRMIKATGIGRDAYIIDVGGGASLLVDHLQQAGYTRLAVLDISRKSLDLAKARLAARVEGKAGDKARAKAGDKSRDKSQSIEWLEADITEFEPPHTYALWHDRAVFHFLTEKPDRIKYVEALKKAVPTGGHVVLAAFAIGGPTKCSGLDIVQYDAPKLLLELGEEFNLVDEASETHTTPGDAKQEFSYFRLTRV